MFRDELIYRSIHSADTGYPIHNSLGDAGPSLIDLWELQQPDARQEIEGWRAPFDGLSLTSPEVRLARRIQAEIKSLVESGTMTGHAGKRRPLRYGDMLVLVRRRGNAFDAVIQALKHAGIPVAGADRLKLTEHIAIIDLMNLADALLLPQDDLALAVALNPRCSAFPTTTCSRWRGSAGARCAMRWTGMLRRTKNSKLRSNASRNASAASPPRHRSRSMPGCSAAMAAGSESSGGSGMKPTTRSTNFSNWRWAMSARRRPRCRASWRGCARPTSK